MTDTCIVDICKGIAVYIRFFTDEYGACQRCMALRQKRAQIFTNKMPVLCKINRQAFPSIRILFHYRLIRASIDKPVYKEKLRVRSYGVPAADSAVFVELKKKYDGVVYKRRITSTPRAAQALLRGVHPAGAQSQIQKEIEYFQQFHRTQPKVFIAYDRQAFQGTENSALRITFDRNMRYRLDRLDLMAGDDGAPILQTDDILMEIKIPGACPLWLTRLLTDDPHPVEATRANWRLPSIVTVTTGADAETTRSISWYTKFSVTGSDIEIVPYSANPSFSGSPTRGGVNATSERHDRFACRKTG